MVWVVVRRPDGEVYGRNSGTEAAFRMSGTSAGDIDSNADALSTVEGSSQHRRVFPDKQKCEPLSDVHCGSISMSRYYFCGCTSVKDGPTMVPAFRMETRSMDL